MVCIWHSYIGKGLKEITIITGERMEERRDITHLDLAALTFGAFLIRLNVYPHCAKMSPVSTVHAQSLSLSFFCVL